MFFVAIIEECCESSGTRAGSLCRREILVVGRGGERAVPTGPCKVSRRRVDDPVAPVNAEHALAAEVLGTLHVDLKTAGTKLGEPHRRIVFDPGDGPTFPVS